jgi:hypothetical protein
MVPVALTAIAAPEVLEPPTAEAIRGTFEEVML